MKIFAAFILLLLSFLIQAQTERNFYSESLYSSIGDSLLRKMNLSALDYWSYGDFDKALEEYRNMLELAERLNNYKFEAMALNNIGFIYAEFGDYLESIEYREKALFIRNNMGDSMGIGLSYNGLGTAYFAIDSIAKALFHYHQAMYYLSALNDSMGISNVYNNLGNLYLKTGELEKALANHNSALLIRQRSNDKRGVAESYKNLSNYYIQIRDFSTAKKMIDKGFAIAGDIESAKLRKLFYFQIYLLYTAEGNYSQALNSYIHFSELGDSLTGAQSRNYINRLMVQYDTERKEQEIAILNAQNQLSEEELQKKRTTLWWLSGILLSLGFFATLLGFLYNQKRRAYKMLVRMNVEAVMCEQKQTDKDNQVKYKGSALDDDQKKDLLKNLNHIMKEEKPFLKHECTIDNLAKQLESNRQYLSQLINQHFGKNFNTYINEFRIKEARKILIDDKENKYSIEGVADMVGFQSRTSFISAFKKYTGVTPSFFKENQEIA